MVVLNATVVNLFTSPHLFQLSNDNLFTQTLIYRPYPILLKVYAGLRRGTETTNSAHTDQTHHMRPTD